MKAPRSAIVFTALMSASISTSLKNDPAILNGIRFASRIALISASGRVGCSPDKITRTLVGSLMSIGESEQVYTEPLSRIPFLAREEQDEAVQSNSKQEQHPCSQKAPSEGKESSGKTSHPIHSWTDGHDLDQSFRAEGNAPPKISRPRRHD